MKKKWKITQIEKDISTQKPSIGGAINRVGIEELEMPIRVSYRSQLHFLPATITALVSLDNSRHRGIHMSRIYFTLHDFLKKKTLTLSSLKKLLNQMIRSQEGLSKEAYLKIKWKWPIKKKALKSPFLEGWHCYPVFYEGSFLKNKTIHLKMGMEVTYSSTCPCSAHLARMLIQKKFKIDFQKNKLNKEEITNWLGKESSISATPHAQKSRACISIEVNREKQPLLDLISEVEQTLGTPVQVAVKRVDEQEFAKLNSENLMFSEDATRRIAHLLSQKPWVTHYQIAVKHFESLHPFEVACYINK